MQTFLPYADFARSAACLDRQRLGKQRIEVLQLLKALLVPGSGWANHPAAKMWRGHVQSLVEYGRACCDEWTARGYKDTCRGKFDETLESVNWAWTVFPTTSPPPWLGDPAFHASHRSNLLRKDPVWYGKFGWTEPHDLPYVWPVPEVLV